MKIWRMFERLAHWVALLLGIVAIVAVGVIIGRPAEKSGNQPNFAGSEQQQKRLAVFLDGTWNSVDSNTNVWRMRALCASKGKDGKPQLVYYSVGVNGFLGGVFGQGLDENIRLAYEWLIENYNDGDEIYIFGFSRAKRPRWHVHLTSTSSSWLNQVERFFALLTDKKIRRGIYRSVAALRADITSFIDRHNADPKPFRWTKSADDILASIERFCRYNAPAKHAPMSRTSGSGH